MAGGGRPRGNGQQDPVKSVTKVLDILEYLGRAKRPVSVSELARDCEVNVSTAYRLLQTLMARGFSEQDAKSRNYLLGPRVFHLGSAYLEGSDLAAIARPHLESLRDVVGETAYLVIFSQGEIVQLCKADGKQAVSASIRPMVREPAYCTATGKILLSGLSPEALEQYLEKVELQAYTPQTVTSADALRLQIQGIRETGFALDIEEFVPNLCCVSVPVRDGAGIVAAMSIAVPKMRFMKAEVPRLCSLLQEKADQMMQQLRLIDN